VPRRPRESPPFPSLSLPPSLSLSLSLSVSVFLFLWRGLLSCRKKIPRRSGRIRKIRRKGERLFPYPSLSPHPPPPVNTKFAIFCEAARSILRRSRDEYSPCLSGSGKKRAGEKRARFSKCALPPPTLLVFR
jgi:hypothetical protein